MTIEIVQKKWQCRLISINFLHEWALVSKAEASEAETASQGATQGVDDPSTLERVMEAHGPFASSAPPAFSPILPFSMASSLEDLGNEYGTFDIQCVPWRTSTTPQLYQCLVGQAGSGIIVQKAWETIDDGHRLNAVQNVPRGSWHALPENPRVLEP